MQRLILHQTEFLNGKFTKFFYMAYTPGMTINLYTQTATKTVTNTVAETSALGTGVGNQTISGGFMVAGRSIRISGGGVYSTPIAASSVIIKVKLGSTVIATVTTSALVSNASNKAYQFTCLISCQSAGSSGSVIVDGYINYASTSNRIFDDLNNAGNATTIDTTVPQLLDVTVQWDTNTTTRSLTTTVAIFEQIN